MKPAPPALPSEPAESNRSPAEERAGRWYAAVGVLCIAFLAFVAGSFVMQVSFAMQVKVLPVEPLRRAFQGGLALYDREFAYRDPHQTDFWHPARTSARGVVRHDGARAQQGLTLYTSAHDHRAYLIDMAGGIVHQWHVPYGKIWERGAKVGKPKPDPFIYIEKAHVFPNGDLLALYAAIGDTPWGYGLIKVDRTGRVLWKYLAHAHHDFTFDDAGNIYVLTHEISEAKVPGYDKLISPRVDDFVVKLSPEGRELYKVWLLGAFAQSRFGGRLHFGPWQAHTSNGDYLHANSVHVLRAPIPGVAESRPGQALVSLREFSTLALFDIETGRMNWAATGPWVRQHDAEVLPNGHILLFDNKGSVGGPGPSRVLEFDPRTYAIAWSYGDRPDQPLNSKTRSSQSRLRNGNTLIVESLAGRVFEVTPSGEIVWEFINPVRGGAKHDRIPIIFWVDRIDPQLDFTPAFRDSLGL